MHCPYTTHTDTPWIHQPWIPPRCTADDAIDLCTVCASQVEQRPEFGEVWLSPSFLADGNVRILRRTAALLRALPAGGETPRVLPEGGSEPLGVRECLFHERKISALYVQGEA